MSVLLLSAEYYSKVCIVTVYLFPLVKDTSLPPAPQHKNTTINHVVFCENFRGIYAPRGGIVGWWTSGFWILINAARKLSREVVPAYTSQHHRGPTSPPFKLRPPLVSLRGHLVWIWIPLVTADLELLFTYLLAIWPPLLCIIWSWSLLSIYFLLKLWLLLICSRLCIFESLDS